MFIGSWDGQWLIATFLWSYLVVTLPLDPGESTNQSESSGNTGWWFGTWPIYSGFTHWKWWFPIVMLVYQRVFFHSVGNGMLSSQLTFTHQPSFFRGVGWNHQPDSLLPLKLMDASHSISFRKLFRWTSTSCPCWWALSIFHPSLADVKRGDLTSRGTWCAEILRWWDDHGICIASTVSG